jgi:circadian clock protein KaiC
MHLLEMLRTINKFQPKVLIIDPISNLTNVGTENNVKFMLTRLIDSLKTMGITTICTSLMESEKDGRTGQGVSSLMDTWIRLAMFENGNERNRAISIAKSRGMSHSNQIREYLITDQGVKLAEVYLGQAAGLLMGSSRAAQEAKEKAEAYVQQHENERRKRELQNRLRSLDAQLDALHSEFELEKQELARIVEEEELKSDARNESRMDMARLRGDHRLQ